jgi:hypothetical protein
MFEHGVRVGKGKFTFSDGSTYIGNYEGGFVCNVVLLFHEYHCSIFILVLLLLYYSWISL